MPENTRLMLGHENPNPGSTSAADVAAVVRIVKTVVPDPATDAGANEQELNLGSPEQDTDVKLMVELYPVCPVTVRVFVAELPWEVLTELFAGEIVKSPSTVILTVPDDEPM